MNRVRPHRNPLRAEVQPGPARCELLKENQASEVPTRTKMQPQKQTPEVFPGPARRMCDDKSPLMPPIEQVKENQAMDARANRFFCGQKVKFIDKREKNKALNRRVRVGCVDPAAIPNKSPGGNFFEDQDIVYEDNSKENFDVSPQVDVGNMIK
ncbi:hypothetical protein NE237_012611 [Protea cynaroides]|uniref:Uncharacterized protein n=1 Tax=Protea cynaroides TaxID=273540 RepID=A0A9Q0GXT4_9MAGN|nr:hypothetical protein NE237_012611 [Protea cynaroides]